jgi:hypothetical protein
VINKLTFLFYILPPKMECMSYSRVCGAYTNMAKKTPSFYGKFPEV